MKERKIFGSGGGKMKRNPSLATLMLLCASLLLVAFADTSSYSFPAKPHTTVTRNGDHSLYAVPSTNSQRQASRQENFAQRLQERRMAKEEKTVILTGEQKKKLALLLFLAGGQARNSIM